MKILSVIIFLTLSVSLFSQRTAREVLETELVKMLQNDKILLNQQELNCSGDCTHIGLWKNDKIKSKTIKRDGELKRRLLSRFNPPFYIDNGLITEDLTFKNKSIGLIGSYIIRNKDLSVINREISPTLPVLASGNQMSILNPKNTGSSYILNYNSSNLFEGNLDGKVSSGFREYYQAKLQHNTNISAKERSVISIGAGVFDNQLAVVYANLNQITSADFGPVYYLWLEHQKGNIKEGDQIIKAFEGLCYFTAKGRELESLMETSAEMSSGAVIPFVRYDAKANAEWTNSKKLVTQQNIYNVYMFKQPDFVDIPGANQIINCWKRLKSDSKPEYLTSNIIPTNQPLMLKVKFGPVPDVEALSSIKLDESYSLNSIPANKRFIKSIKLITDDPKRISVDGDYYFFIVEIERNENFLTQNYNLLSHIISAELPIRLYYDNPIGKDTLDIKYPPIEIQTERFPTPQVSDFEIKPEKQDRWYNYQTTIRFLVSNYPITITNIPKPPKVIDVIDLPNSVDPSIKRYITDASFQFRNLNEFTMSFNLPVFNKFFNINQRSIEMVLILEFYANNGSSYKRKLPIKLIAPPELLEQQASSGANIMVKDNGEVLELLNRKAFVNDRLSINDIFVRYEKGNNTDVLGLISELKKYEVIKSTILGYYSVPVKYIDFSKVRR